MAIPQNVITQDDSLLALERDLKDLSAKFNPAIVKISRKDSPKKGLLARLTVTVNAPSHYLTSEDDTTPKACSRTVFYVDVKDGYPEVKVDVYYPVGRRLASVNVYRSGRQCIDDWHAYSSICTAIEKTVRDIIHDPVVAGFTSRANSALTVWQREMIARGLFPTIPTTQLFRHHPARTPAARSGVAPRSLPGKVGRSQPAAQARRAAPPPLPVSGGRAAAGRMARRMPPPLP